MEEQRDWLTTAEVAAELGITPMRVRQWLTSGDLQSQKVGGTHLIPRAAIEPLRHRKTQPGPEKGSKRTTPAPDRP